ncbi:hypothetical protein Tco_0505080 [Tanacetum coccineum]
MFIPNNSTVSKLQTAEDLQGDALLHYDAEMELMNLILLSIPNDIYNSVDACTSAKDMWKRVERLMRGTIQNKVDRETRFTNEFDQFVAEPGEALVSVYNRFAQLMNDLERNDMHFPIVTINTKFLNSLQPEWLKYVTQVRLAKRLTVDTFDDLFDYLQQFEKLVNVSRAKKLEKSHDPLALVAHTGSSSRNTSSYYVTHPTSVVDYEDEYQQDDVHTNSEDPLASAMLLLARAITQCFSTPINNRLRTSNTRNQAIIQGDRLNIQSRNSGNTEEILSELMFKRTFLRNCPKARVRDSNTFMNEMMLAKQDEAGVLLTDEHNDILFQHASRMKKVKKLSAHKCLMAKFKPANNTLIWPSYDSAFISEISFEDLDKQRDKLDLAVNDYKQKNEELQKTHLILKRQMSKNEDRYHDTILDLEAKLKKNVDLILKLGNSLQGMFMLGPKAIVCLSNSEILLNVKDTEDTLDDASKISSASTHVSTGRRVSIVSTGSVF